MVTTLARSRAELCTVTSLPLSSNYDVPHTYAQLRTSAACGESRCILLAAISLCTSQLYGGSSGLRDLQQASLCREAGQVPGPTLSSVQS